MSNVEALLKAYVELSLMWSKTGIGDTPSRYWASCHFLEKQIKKELEKTNATNV